LNIVDEIHTIFAAMLPSFTHMARRYQIANPEDWAKEWQTNAYLIALKFDKGDLVKKGLVDGTDGLVEGIDDASFLKSFRGYLMTAYRNELNANFAKNKTKKNVSLFTEDGDTISALPSCVTDDAPNEHVYLEDILPILERDCRRTNRLAETPSEACTAAFNQATLSALKSMKSKWDGIPVLADINQQFESGKIACDFLPEWRERTKFAFAHLLLQETCPFTVQKMSVVLFSEQDFAVTKRFERYLTDHLGGLSQRIKANKAKQ
jgi:hypothetical protein